MRQISASILFLLIILFACQTDDNTTKIDFINYDLNAYEYTSEIPDNYELFTQSISDKQAALGRLLFYDPLLSLNKNISCGSCHLQSKSFADNSELGFGLFGNEISRNTQNLTYAAFQGRFFWDSRSRNLTDAVLEPILNHSEMAINDIATVIERLQNTEHYPVLFEEAFSFLDEPEKINEENLATALSDFIKAMYSFNAPVDIGSETNFENFTIEEKLGKKLFEGKAKCQSCHQSDIYGSYYGTANIGLYEEYEDQGAGKGRFRVPSLRNIEFSAPYMHDGSIETLEEVIEHYNSGINSHESLSWHLTTAEDKKPIRLNLSQDEKDALLAFLKTLTDRTIMTDDKFSNPFK